MKQIDPEVRAILSTGFGIDGQAHQMIAEGILGIIPKPYNIRQLFEAVNKVLRKD
jgi:DNA-binding NarL/FixJ family response regulator